MTNHFHVERVVPVFDEAPAPTLNLREITERRFNLRGKYKDNDMLDRHDERTITANVDDFLLSNSDYSFKSMRLAESKGLR